MTTFIHIPSDAETDDDVFATEDAAAVNIYRYYGHARYGDKLGIELPAPWDDDGEAKDHFKELDWDLTHRSWNDRGKEWEADFKQLNAVIEHMNDGGYAVTVALDLAKKFEKAGFRFLPKLRDDYVDPFDDD